MDTLTAGRKSLVFIDSPPGTDNRSLVVDQIIRLAPKADHYAFHDSIRDARIVYRLSSALDLSIVRHVPSQRGLTFLGQRAVVVSQSELE